MKYEIRYTGQFKKSVKVCKKRGYDMSLIKKVITLLAENGELPPKYKPHILSGRLAGVWECHITSDWLLLWTKEHNEIQLILLDTGTHADLFK